VVLTHDLVEALGAQQFGERRRGAEALGPGVVEE